MKKEFDDNLLPPLRLMQMYSAKGKGMSRWMVFFYTIPILSFILISVMVTALNVSISFEDSIMSYDQSMWVLILICLIQFFVSLFLHNYKSKVGSLAAASLFGDEKFTDLTKGSMEEKLHKIGEKIKEYNSDK